MKTTGIVLAGGRGTRASGADKGLLPWGDSTRIESALAHFAPQVDAVIVSCNRNLPRYQALAARLDFSTVTDTLANFQGPLAGIAAALARCDSGLAVVMPCDCPQPPPDLVERLRHCLVAEELQLCFAEDGTRGQYLFCALYTDCLDSLNAYLCSGQRSVKGWHQQLHCRAVDFSDCPQYFANHNQA